MAAAPEDSLSNIPPAKRTHENILLTERKRLKHISFFEKDCSMRIRSQKITFHSLPDDILSIIVSRLTLKEAVRTSVVSSNWRHIWKCHPNLRFDISSVLGSKAKRKRSSDQHKRMLRKRFIDRVSYILSKHSGLAVSKLAVKFDLREEHANHIDGWVYFAIASMVLRLDSINLVPSIDFCCFANLQMLALDHVLVMQDLQYLLSKCPALEWLSIRWCYLKCNCHASAPLSRLKYLCVKNCEVDRIEFVAPNLNTFEYRGYQILIKFHECSKLKMEIIDIITRSTLEYVFTVLPNAVPHVETLRVETFVNAEVWIFLYMPDSRI